MASLYPDYKVPAHVTYNPYEFEGAVTGLLLTDGVYEKCPRDEEVARSLSRDFMNAIFGRRRWSGRAFRILEWQSCISFRFIALNQRARQWWLFEVTDDD